MIRTGVLVAIAVIASVITYVVSKGKLADVTGKIPLDKAAKAVSKGMEKSDENGGGFLYTYAITVVIGSSGSSQQTGKVWHSLDQVIFSFCNGMFS